MMTLLLLLPDETEPRDRARKERVQGPKAERMYVTPHYDSSLGFLHGSYSAVMQSVFINCHFRCQFVMYYTDII